MRLIMNVFIRAVILMVLNALHVLSLMNSGRPVYGWDAFVVALLISFIFMVVNFIVVKIWAVASILTLGILLLALPFIGAIGLWVISIIFPQNLAIEWFWPMLISGLLMMFLVLSKPSPPATATTYTTSTRARY
jgi:hypothetical protein